MSDIGKEILEGLKDAVAYMDGTVDREDAYLKVISAAPDVVRKALMV